MFGEDFAPQGLASADDVQDVLAIMIRQEGSVYGRNDYLSSGRYAAVMDGTWRQRILEWMYGVVDHCGLRRDSVAVAGFYLDVAVQHDLVTSRQEYQLAAMTALQLAIKMYDSTVVKMESMIKLGRGLFTVHDVVQMEQSLLKALAWHVHPPTAVCFLRQYLRLLPDSVSPVTKYMLGEVTRFLAEISVCLARFVSVPCSQTAYASMLIAMERMDANTLPVWQRRQIFNTIAEATGLVNTAPEMITLVQQLQRSTEKNCCISDLIRTIDAQCHPVAYLPHPMPSQAMVDYSRVITSNQSSPRDVIAGTADHSHHHHQSQPIHHHQALRL